MGIFEIGNNTIGRIYTIVTISFYLVPIYLHLTFKHKNMESFAFVKSCKRFKNSPKPKLEYIKRLRLYSIMKMILIALIWVGFVIYVQGN